MGNLFKKDVPFTFNKEYVQPFEILKKALTPQPIIRQPTETYPLK
jgi:hypothetical protein